jgi:flagellar hook-length control protein FliK
LPELDEEKAGQDILNGLPGQLPAVSQGNVTVSDLSATPYLAETGLNTGVIDAASSTRPTVPQAKADNLFGNVTFSVADPADANSNSADAESYLNLSSEAGKQQSQIGSKSVANNAASFAESLAELSTETTAKVDNVSGKLSVQPQVESRAELAKAVNGSDKLSVQSQIESQTKPASSTPQSPDLAQSTIPTQTTATFSMPEITAVEASPKLPNIPALHQIVESVGLMTQQGHTKVHLQLYPEELGQVLVQLHIANGDVTVQMLAETPQAQSLIQDHLSQLKAAFAGQGLQANGLSVAVGSDASAFDTPNGQANDGFQKPNYRQTNSESGDLQPSAPAQAISNLGKNLHVVNYQV